MRYEIDISAQEIVEALNGPAQYPDGAFTTEEVHRRTGASIPRIQRALRILREQGRLEVMRVKRESLDGRMLSHTVYRVKE